MNTGNLLLNMRICKFYLILFFLVSSSSAQNSSPGTSFEKYSANIDMNSAYTVEKAHYSFGLKGLTLQREYYVFENNNFRIPRNNSSVFGIPLHVGITDFLELSGKINFVHDVRPYEKKSDIYQYHSSSESGIGVSKVAMKIRLPVSKENRLQIAGKFGAIVNTSKNQIDGMLYQWTRKDGIDFEASLLETINLNSSMSIHLEQGYVLSGSDIYDDQVVFSAGLDVHPFRKWSFGLEVFNRTFMGVSPQSVIKSVYDPFEYWDDYSHLGDPAYLKDEDLDFLEDYFVVAPSIYYKPNNLVTLNAGVAVNIADQRGPQELLQFTFGITVNGTVKSLVDSDKDGVNDKKDKEPNTRKGYPVDKFGVSLDTDRDGVPDGRDNQPNTPKGATVDESGVALDTDGDGVYDGIDSEPDTPEGSEVDANGVALDDDGDGVPNYSDREPDTPDGVDVDEHGVALDDDGDGVPDWKDVELNTPKGVRVNSNGAALIVETKEEKVEILPYSIHVASYRNEKGAEQEIKIYNIRGYEAFKLYMPVPGKGNWYRVFVGRYKTEAEAKSAAKILIDRGYAKYTKTMKIE